MDVRLRSRRSSERTARRRPAPTVGGLGPGCSVVWRLRFWATLGQLRRGGDWPSDHEVGACGVRHGTGRTTPTRAGAVLLVHGHEALLDVERFGQGPAGSEHRVWRLAERPWSRRSPGRCLPEQCLRPYPGRRSPLQRERAPHVTDWSSQGRCSHRRTRGPGARAPVLRVSGPAGGRRRVQAGPVPGPPGGGAARRPRRRARRGRSGARARGARPSAPQRD